jgi:type VI protein secretion system component VasK
VWLRGEVTSTASVQKGKSNMNRRTTGLLMAVVAVVTSLIVLLRAEKPRRFLQARVEQVRGALPEPEQVRQSAQQVATRVSHLASDAKGTTQQAMNKVK